MKLISTAMGLFGPFSSVTNNAGTFDADGVIYPAGVLASPQVIDVALPADFTADGYTWDGTKLVKKIITPTTAQRTEVAKLIDADADRIYVDVIGNRATEYSQAEKEATDFKAAGYPAGSVPPSVDSWAVAKSQTAAWAADDIITQATAWRTAAAAIRANRLKEKEAARVAVSMDALNAAHARWSAFNYYIRGILGI